MKDNGRYPLYAGFALLSAFVALGILSLLDERFFYPLLFLFLLGPPLWTYLNARASERKGAFFWALLALFANVIGMIFYYISAAGKEEETASTCSRCHKEIRAAFSRCPHCGLEERTGDEAPRESGGCPRCGRSLEPAWRFCPYCRADLGAFDSCGGCGAAIQLDWNSCPRCGRNLHPAR